MRVLRGLLFFIVAVVVGAVVISLFLPQRARVERSVLLDAPPATVFTVLNGFRQFNRWSPWAGLDPATNYRYEGPVMGVGARMSWSSTQEAVGSGSQEIIESTPHSLIRVRLIFGGFSTVNTASYVLTPEGPGTRLVWAYESEFGYDLVGRWFGLMLDSFIGKDYERGLAQLKTLIGTLPKADLSQLQVELVQAPAQPIAYIRGRSRTDAAAIGKAYSDAYTRITQTLGSVSVQPAGPVLAIGRRWDAQAGVYEFDAAIPVPAGIELPPGPVKLGQTYAGSALKATHRGPYAELVQHFEQVMAYKAVAGFESNGDPWDVYVSDPATTPAPELVTESWVPVK